MKRFIAFLPLIALFVIGVTLSYAQQNRITQKPNPEIEVLKQRISEFESKLQTVESVEKMELAAKLAEAQSKLANGEFGKFERELRDSNNRWLWGWTGFFVGIAAVVGVALWFVVKSLIADRVEKSLNGFKKAVEQVKIQQDKIRIIERDYAALMLAEPDEYSDDEGYVYPETVRSLPEQTVLDVIYHETYYVFVRVRAAELLKKRDPIRSIPILLELVNSFLDSDIYKDVDVPTLEHLRELFDLFKDIHTDETYVGLSKLLAHVLKSKEDSELNKTYLNSTIFSLAYVGDGLNTGNSIPKMREAIPYLQILLGGKARP